MKSVAVTRRFRICKIDKSLAELVPNKKSLHGRKLLCKDCAAEYWRARRATDPLTRQRHVDAVLRSKMLSKLGLTTPEYKKMVENQDDRCKLCGGTDKGRHARFRTWNIDHDHKTNRVRGLLCHSCNISIGHYEKLMERVGLDAIHTYLSHPRTPE